MVLVCGCVGVLECWRVSVALCGSLRLCVSPCLCCLRLCLCVPLCVRFSRSLCLLYSIRVSRVRFASPRVLEFGVQGLGFRVREGSLGTWMPPGFAWGSVGLNKNQKTPQTKPPKILKALKALRTLTKRPKSP